MAAKESIATDPAAGDNAEAVQNHEVTPGVSKEAETIDAPLAIAGAGPRDALTDPHPDDYIPDLEEKGYHVGMVRQPAEIVGVGGRQEGFRSTGGESRFPSLKDAKLAHNAREAKAGESFGRAASPDPTPGISFMPGIGAVRLSPADAAEATAPAKPAKPAKAKKADAGAAKVETNDATGSGADATNPTA